MKGSTKGRYSCEEFECPLTSIKAGIEGYIKDNRDFNG
jgi:hypothetical protein